MVEMGENKIKELVLKLDLGCRVTVEVGRAMLPVSPASAQMSVSLAVAQALLIICP